MNGSETEEFDKNPTDLTKFEIVSALFCLQNDFKTLRSEFSAFQEKITSILIEVKEESKKLKAPQSLINGFTMKDLIQARALGIKPQDLITGKAFSADGKTQEKSNSDTVSSL